MSLKVEQILDNFFFTENEPKIYTTGAYLVPMKIKMHEKERFVWVAWEFNDNSYFNDELCSPNIYSDKLETLIAEEDS